MRKVILNVAVTLDGFIEGPNGEIDWLVGHPGVDFGDILNEILSDKDAIFYGRISYDKWGNFEPDNDVSPKIREAYKLLHSKQKYVFSTTKTADDSDAIFINSDIKEKVSEIKQQPGENIWLYGGAMITTALMNLGLVDEFRLAVHPVIIGEGKPLFQNIRDRHKLKLIDVTGYDSGVVLTKYQTDDDANS